MTHKAGRDFFKVKLDWSKRKDMVLGSYLVPYLPKIATQRRPVLVVDGFAGPGKFDDGEPGSPLLICQVVRGALSRPGAGQFEVWAIERDPELAGRLATTLGPFSDFATVRQAAFADVLVDIEAKLATHNVFLYLDPFTVCGLSWQSLDRVFAHVGRLKSVEVLMNFNVVALARIGCAALGRSFQQEVDSEAAMVEESTATARTVDEALGGDWWRSRLLNSPSFPAACASITDGYIGLLRKRFAEVCCHEIKERHAHALSKYLLVFGSRHPHALDLMNDVMAKSLKRLADQEAPPTPTLFELRDERLVPELSRIQGHVLDVLTQRMTRGLLIQQVTRRDFGRYTQAEIRGQIEAMLKAGVIRTADGKTRINNETVILPPAV